MSYLEKIYRISRLTLVFLFVYHGLVPKIFWLSPGEVEMITAMGGAFSVEWVAIAGAVFDLLIALVLLVFYRKLWPLILAAVALVFLLVSVAVFLPIKLVAAFNPVTLNLCGIALCFIAILTLKEMSLVKES